MNWVNSFSASVAPEFPVATATPVALLSPSALLQPAAAVSFSTQQFAAAVPVRT
ncbi:hypothetical protein PF005_g4759 [Phytophthora fragariae]|uniref:Uncharacterized protein n=2 Tax=Phytophthora TaxID=4783 RepID=A0A6A3V2A7_9STRA|nr:hypothetical protein PF003_g14395 [Phytophthora fragariae]KAE9033743.1 hypothetical protein PR002_g8511 [Phytophthora rubi]KAE8945484.1 hypothetical protein PF009_g4866 [Phytophthora fragariae]KAE9013721.1 hypothetical protein PF011_g8365 [Phytophthora fragariae]KAE9036155.1 hypothetical protein PR001_g8972 [Phytophthora rubi]